MTPERIVVAKPPIGAKSYVFDRTGLFVLEEQPGNIFHVTCTHSGAGTISVRDLDDRRLMQLSPTAMGTWHLNCGFNFGLVVEVTGSHPPIHTVVWYTKPEKNDSLVFPKRKSQQLENGLTILCHHDCLLYECLVPSPGAGTIELFDGEGRKLYHFRTTLRGSFLLEHVFAKGGLVAKVNSSVPVNAEVVWLEQEES